MENKLNEELIHQQCLTRRREIHCVESEGVCQTLLKNAMIYLFSGYIKFRRLGSQQINRSS